MKGQWTQQRRRNCFTLKTVVAACLVLFFFSPAFSRKLPAGKICLLALSLFFLEMFGGTEWHSQSFHSCTLVLFYTILNTSLNSKSYEPIILRPHV